VKFRGVFFICVFLVFGLSYPSAWINGVESGTPEHHFFRALEINKPGHVFFKFKNVTKTTTTLTGKPIEILFPKGNEKNWYAKYCFFGFCFTEEANSNTKLKPGQREEMTGTFFPLPGSKIGEKAKMVLDVWPTNSPELKERLWFYGVVVDPKTVLLKLNSTTCEINGKQQTLDAKPFINPTTNRTLVPFRFLGETFGAKIQWIEKEKKVTYELGDEKLTFILGTAEVKMQLGPDYSKMLPLESPSKLTNNRLFVPVRIVSELLGSMVTWEGSSQSIKIVFPHLPSENPVILPPK